MLHNCLLAGCGYESGVAIGWLWGYVMLKEARSFVVAIAVIALSVMVVWVMPAWFWQKSESWWVYVLQKAVQLPAVFAVMWLLIGGKMLIDAAWKRWAPLRLQQWGRECGQAITVFFLLVVVVVNVNGSVPKFAAEYDKGDWLFWYTFMVGGSIILGGYFGVTLGVAARVAASVTEVLFPPALLLPLWIVGGACAGWWLGHRQGVYDALWWVEGIPRWWVVAALGGLLAVSAWWRWVGGGRRAALGAESGSSMGLAGGAGGPLARWRQRRAG